MAKPNIKNVSRIRSSAGISALQMKSTLKVTISILMNKFVFLIFWINSPEFFPNGYFFLFKIIFGFFFYFLVFFIIIWISISSIYQGRFFFILVFSVKVSSHHVGDLILFNVLVFSWGIEWIAAAFIIFMKYSYLSAGLVYMLQAVFLKLHWYSGKPALSKFHCLQYCYYFVLN